MFVHHVFIHDRHLGNISQHEITSLRDPEVEIEGRFHELVQDEISVLSHLGSLILQIGVSGLRNLLQAASDGILNDVVLAVHVVLMD